MNVLFTTSAAPKKSPFFTDEKRPPLGMGSLISLTRNDKHKVFFIDNYLKPSDFIEEGYLQKNKIDHVAIHANTICYRDTLRMFNELANLRKKGLWEGKIIVGGPHTSVALNTIPEFVDYVVQGEGERAILKIINGEVKERVISEDRIKDLDSLPFQPWDVFNSLPYDYTCPWLDIQPVFTMNTSRGCPFGCTFCSVESIWGREYTYFSPDRMTEEIRYLIKEYGAKGIYFREDNFTLNVKRTEEFCRQLMRKNLGISWACETRVNNLSADLVQLMSAAGCRALYLGVESGSQKVLDKLKKGITIQQTNNTVRWCKQYDIKAYCSLIIGTPGETYEDYLETKNLMENLKPHVFGFNVFVGIPKSPLYDHILADHLYEYQDDIGLLYLPGYDVKTRYFYAMNCRDLVDHEFKGRTTFDIKLENELEIRESRKRRPSFFKSLLSFDLYKRLTKLG